MTFGMVNWGGGWSMLGGGSITLAKLGIGGGGPVGSPLGMGGGGKSSVGNEPGGGKSGLWC